LDRFDLTEAADRPVKTYSGGMRRRVDLAATLMVQPTVLVLDEPTAGLDLRSRLSVWAAVRELAAKGVGVLLTTQYLEEADQLADHITVLDRGRVVASGQPRQLKERVGGLSCEIAVNDLATLGRAAALVARVAAATPRIDGAVGRVSVPAPGGPALVADLLAAFRAEGIALDDISLRRPSLDDVFLALTGDTSAVPSGSE
jgi:ABC-2 type transport system ATP-binding protein